MRLIARISVVHALLLVALWAAHATDARAQTPQAGAAEEGAFDPEPEYQVEPDRRIWLRGLLDLRVVRGGAAPSWTDAGPGRTRYGGEFTDEGFERETKFVLSQFALELGVALPGGIRGQAQINIQPDYDDYRPWLIEAFLRREWGSVDNGFGLQAGLMGQPFSLEHVGPAWSPQYSISPSALDAWLWGEISLAGAEAEWWHDTDGGVRLGVLFGAGFGPDQLGRLVALAGWTISDGLSGWNTEPTLPSGVRTQLFDELDDRPAGYTWLSIGDTRERATLRVGHFDNFGDQDVTGVWHTRFSVAGLSLRPHPRFELIGQYLHGEARVRDTTNDSTLRAWYALLTHQQGRHRVSVRYDSFSLEDDDGGSATAENGEGVTFAWLLQFGLRHQVGFEHIWLDVERQNIPPSAQAQDGWQLSYRFRY